MEMNEAIGAFTALGHETRLTVFRLLVVAGPSGLAAGAVAEQAGVPPSTMSHHLGLLERAGLVRSWRVHRQIFYASDYEGTRKLLSFLMEDCCQGRPELCGGELVVSASGAGSCKTEC